MNTEKKLHNSMEEAKTFVKNNLAVLCADVLEFSEGTLLKQTQKLKHLKEILEELDKNCSLTLACNMVKMESMRTIVGLSY